MANGNGNRGQRKKSLKGKELELLVVSLILTNKLKVQDVTVNRVGEYSVSLKGSFDINEEPNQKVKALSKFIEENPDLTITDIIETIRNHGKR